MKKGKELYRSKKNRILGGVCGGIGEFLETDPTIIRLIWIVLTLVSAGIGIVGYILAWIIVPEKREASKASSKKTVKKTSARKKRR